MAEITFPEWVVLRAISNAGGKMPSTRLQSRWSSVKRLEEKGKVKITHDSHGSSYVELTDAGRKVLRSTSYKMREAEGW